LGRERDAFVKALGTLEATSVPQPGKISDHLVYRNAAVAASRPALTEGQNETRCPASHC
jgi:hypothetical protein